MDNMLETLAVDNVQTWWVSSENPADINLLVPQYIYRK